MIEYNGENYESLIEKGLIAIQYYATWCGPCKMLGPILESISEERKDLTFYRIDIDKYRAQATEVGIRSVPTIVLYRDGKEVDRVSGYQPKEKVLQWLDQGK